MLFPSLDCKLQEQGPGVLFTAIFLELHKDDGHQLYISVVLSSKATYPGLIFPSKARSFFPFTLVNWNKQEEAETTERRPHDGITLK